MAIFDDWADDNNSMVDPGELHTRLIQLRENEQPGLPAEGQARQRRIKKMENQLNELAEFINDCDRWSEQTRDVQLIGKDVRILMDDCLAKFREKAKKRGVELHIELQYIKSQTRAS
jgi:hypothetical protein